MRITANGLLFDSNDPRCQLIVTEPLNPESPIRCAFVTAVDVEKQTLRRRFGTFDMRFKESCIANILVSGVKWPGPFRNVALPLHGEVDQSEQSECVDNNLLRQLGVTLAG